MHYLTTKDIERIAEEIEVCDLASLDIDIKKCEFDVGDAKEYETFIKSKAPYFDSLHITKTYVLLHKKAHELVGYFTLSTDSVRLTNSEKEGTDLKNVSFMSLPAIKIGKLAINKKYSCKGKRYGYGSFAIEMANSFAYEVEKNGVSCRFLTVDADIEYDKNTPKFYEKNGFKYNLSIKRNSKTKTVSMRKDIYS